MKKLTRLTANDHQWHTPSGHPWSQGNQGNSNIPYENQYGYGHEEWLLNPLFRLDGYQYGFIRGLDYKHAKRFKEVHLYTVKTVRDRKVVYYLGYLEDVEVFGYDTQLGQHFAQQIYAPHFANMVADVRTAGGDWRNFAAAGAFTPVIRFKQDAIHLLNHPIELPNFDLGKYKRFIAYNLSGSLSDMLRAEWAPAGFVSGKASQTYETTRTSNEGTSTVTRLHSQIVDALEKSLAPTYSVAKDNLSIELMRFDNAIADVVTQSKNGIIEIYEVKTKSSAKNNIRKAIGQLLEYACFSTQPVDALHIVSPATLDSAALKFLKFLNEHQSIPIHYHHYDTDTKRIRRHSA